MSNEQLSIHIVELLGKKADWKSLSEKFFLHCKHKGNKKLLESNGSTSDLDKIPIQYKSEIALEGDMDLNKGSENLARSMKLSMKISFCQSTPFPLLDKLYLYWFKMRRLLISGR